MITTVIVTTDEKKFNMSSVGYSPEQAAKRLEKWRPMAGQPIRIHLPPVPSSIVRVFDPNSFRCCEMVWLVVAEETLKVDPNYPPHPATYTCAHQIDID